MMLMNACDVMLLTSFSEGSPQFIKEAMACNRPIVSTNVGDVKKIISDTEGCFITGVDAKDVAEKLGFALKFRRTEGRDHILSFENSLIATKILNVYKRIL
jgi:glycosyltransferase involved in cell wall biosynthesis